MPHSRYQGNVTPTDSRNAHQLIQGLIGQPFESQRESWERFVKDFIRLPLCYLDSVHMVIVEGRWKAKFDPLAFIRKTAQTTVLASFGLAKPERDKTKIYVGRAIDRDQRRPTLDQSLRFNPPKQRPKVYAGNIADLKLPTVPDSESEGGFHDRVVDYFNEAYGRDDSHEPRHRRDIAPDVLKALSPELLNELDSEFTDIDDPVFDPRVDWMLVADKAGLDRGERMVLRCRLNGESRDSAIARQRSPEKQRYVQAAWRRLDRKWDRIKDAIKKTPSTPPIMPEPIAASGGVVAAPEALRQLKERRETEKNSLPFKREALPRYTDYSR